MTRDELMKMIDEMLDKVEIKADAVKDRQHLLYATYRSMFDVVMSFLSVRRDCIVNMKKMGISTQDAEDIIDETLDCIARIEEILNKFSLTELKGDALYGAVNNELRERSIMLGEKYIEFHAPKED